MRTLWENISYSCQSNSELLWSKMENSWAERSAERVMKEGWRKKSDKIVNIWRRKRQELISSMLSALTGQLMLLLLLGSEIWEGEGIMSYPPPHPSFLCPSLPPTYLSCSPSSASPGPRFLPPSCIPPAWRRAWACLEKRDTGGFDITQLELHARIKQLETPTKHTQPVCTPSNWHFTIS